eukprot:m.41529 g.41529  ORF g.41529 m.41529 type:complete len:160 (+) comp11834_c0_seq2:273-752(+)
MLVSFCYRLSVPQKFRSVSSEVEPRLPKLAVQVKTLTENVKTAKQRIERLRREAARYSVPKNHESHQNENEDFQDPPFLPQLEVALQARIKGLRQETTEETQRHLLAETTKFIQERNEKVKQLHEDMQDVSQLFKRVADTVASQKDGLGRVNLHQHCSR